MPTITTKQGQLILNLKTPQSFYNLMKANGISPITHAKGKFHGNVKQHWFKSDVGRYLANKRRNQPTTKEGKDLYWECLRSFDSHISHTQIDSSALTKLHRHHDGKLRDIKNLFFEIGIDFNVVLNNGYPLGIEVKDRV